MPYLYETHLHTKESSACGKSSGYEYIQKYLDAGYSGIIVTDHFYRGYTAVNKNLSWDKWVNQYCMGFEKAREEGIRRGLDVFFGWEETFEGDDYLIYGLDKQWLLEHPQAAYWNRKRQYDEVKRGGGCVVQAHPFRQAHYINTIHLSTGCVDAVEAANAGNERDWDVLAFRYAKKLNLPVTAGSDTHSAINVNADSVYGVYMDKKMESITDFVNAIRNDKKDSRRCSITGLKVPDGHFESGGSEQILLPVDIRDSRDRSTGNAAEFLGE